MRIFATTKALSLATVTAVALLAFTLVSCSDNTVGAGNYDAQLELTGVVWQSPDSTGSPDELNPGDLVALQGQNMNSVARVFFNGVEASFNPALASEQSLVVSVPGDLPFGELDPEGEEFNTIRVANNGSEATLDFPVLPPAPVLREMSNEHAFPGDEVTLYGQYLYLIESITFPDDVTISGEDADAAADGSSVTFTLPEGVNTAVNGNVSITTAAGSDDSDPAFLFHGYRGVILDMLNGGGPIADPVHGGPQIEQWQYWAAIHPYSGDVYASSAEGLAQGAEGDFVIVKQAGGGAIGTGDNAWYNNHRSIQLNGGLQWVPPESMSESPGNFAVKFEMAINGEWTTGAFQILLTETNYAALIQPWYNEQGQNAAVSYNGWRTYTVPFSAFRADGGSGGAATNLASLFGSDGIADAAGNPPGFRFLNAAPAQVAGELPAGVEFGIDKIRIVRIAGGE